LPVEIIRPRDFATPEEFSARIAGALQSARVDLGFSALGNAPNLHELAIANGDIGENPRIAGAVQHAAVPNHEVVCRLLRAWAGEDRRPQPGGTHNDGDETAVSVQRHA